MLTFHNSLDHSQIAVGLDAAALPPEVNWIDALDPTREETAFIERALALVAPSRERMSEIETSSRLYRLGDTLYLTISMIYWDAARIAQSTPLAFVLGKGPLLTMRFRSIKACDARQYSEPNTARGMSGGVAAFISLLEEIVDQLAARIAAERGHAGKYAVTLSRSSIEPFLQFSARRDLREKAFRAWGQRGENGGKTDNRAIAAEMVRLRAERARLMGYETFAHYRLADTMAKTPRAALDLLESVWTPGVASARKEQEALQEIVAGEGGNFEVAPWDWRHFAEKRRKAEFDFDEGEIKPYLQLDRLIEAAFYAAGRLFGLSFAERFDLKNFIIPTRAPGR